MTVSRSSQEPLGIKKQFVVGAQQIHILYLFIYFFYVFFFHSWLSNIANTKKQHNKFPNTINIYPLLQQPSINKGTINHLVADDIRITIKLNQKWYVNFLSESDFGGFCHSRLFSRKFLTYTTEIGRITFNDRLLKQWQIFHLW